MAKTLLLLLPLALVPAPARAQEALDSRWLPWLGCWQAGEESFMPEQLLVCVRPAPAGSGVEIVTMVDGEVASTRTLVADGERHDVTEDDCSGWRSASFAADGRRVLLRSELTCEGGGKRTASGIMAIASPNEWLDAQAIGLDGERMPRVFRYARALEPPEEFALPADRAARAREARMLAAAGPSLDDVREAAAQVDPEALVAFLIERNHAFELDAASVGELADAGVPADVIDVVVAVSYPGTFAIDREAMRTALRPRQESGETRRGHRGYGDPFGWGWGGRGRYGACYGGLWYWSLYCSPYSYGAYGWGYGGWYDPYWYGYSRPVIIVRDTPSGPQGRAVRSRGYTRGGRPPDSGDARTAQPRGGSGGPSPSVGSGGGSNRGSGGGSASPGGYGRGGSSGSSSGGTARPRGGRE